MSKFHYLALLAVLPAAAWVGWRMGDARGVGAACGASLAALISLAGWWAQDRAPNTAGASAKGAGSISFMTAFALAFLVKLFVLVTGAVVLRFHGGLGELADWRAYLVGFAAAVAWVVFIGTFRLRRGTSRARKEAAASC